MKLAIGREAAKLFDPGDSIFIDGGTTTSLFAAELGKVGSFAVITNSVLIASQLWNAPNRSDVYLLGGRYSGDNQEVVGPLTVEQIHDLHADHVVLTIGAMDNDGSCMDFNADEAFVARAMIARARTVTILADGSKLQRNALFQVALTRWMWPASARLALGWARVTLSPEGRSARSVYPSRTLVW